jgi:hypothetical protein
VALRQTNPDHVLAWPEKAADYTQRFAVLQEIGESFSESFSRQMSGCCCRQL